MGLEFYPLQLLPLVACKQLQGEARRYRGTRIRTSAERCGAVAPGGVGAREIGCVKGNRASARCRL